jgi:ribosomal protein S18 acetylase RimI-like enzyme
MTLDQTTIRRLLPADAEALTAFYNGLGTASKRTFRPLDETTTRAICAGVAAGNAGGLVAGDGSKHATKYDLIALTGDRIIGWSFLWELDAKSPDEGPVFGLAVADAYHGIGLGTRLTGAVITWADGENLPQVILTVVQDNVIAQHIYERQGFVRYGEFVGKDGLDYHKMRRRGRSEVKSPES